MIQNDCLVIAPEVADALRDRRPVVALESTLISHGLPYPQNVEVATASEQAIRGSGAVPATVAMRDGRLLVGLAAGDLEALATAPGGSVRKVSRHSLAEGAAAGGWSATTVSATMIAAHAAGIRVFATGGIGGVHRGGQDSLDISSDLDELARTPVTVICAGPKSILDVGRTLEVLETRGVPVVGFGTSDLPGFFSRESGHTVPVRVDSAEEAARLIRTHDRLGLGSGILVTVPLPEADAIPREEIEAAIDQAVRETDAAGIHGPASTPAVLARVAVLTEGRSVKANLALIEHDASVAAQIAMALAALG